MKFSVAKRIIEADTDSFVSNLNVGSRRVSQSNDDNYRGSTSYEYIERS